MFMELSIGTRTRAELVDITAQIQEAVARSSIAEGLCYLFVPHTTAGLTLNENWDPAVGDDIMRALDKLVPSVGDHQHAEGNSPAHIKAALLGFSAVLPVAGSLLVLGAWQGVYLAEFDGPRQRHVVLRVMQG